MRPAAGPGRRLGGAARDRGLLSEGRARSISEEPESTFNLDYSRPAALVSTKSPVEAQRWNARQPRSKRDQSLPFVTCLP